MDIMSEKYSVGKLPPDILEKNVLHCRGAARRDVLIGPGLGEDAALVRWGGAPYLVAASDPIVGAKMGAGRLLVHVNANDVACKGGDPSWFIVTLIIPVGDGLNFIRYIMDEIHLTCELLGIAVVGGHTELSDRYDHPVLVGTMMGTSSYDLRANLIQAGDVILATKHAGLEGMSIIAHDRPDLLSFLSAEELEEARSWQGDLSVLREARLLRDISRYMHDPTEGGILGAIGEIRDACGLDVALDNQNIPLSPLTIEAAHALGFDPLRLISSGMLLSVLSPDNADEAISRLSSESVKIPAKIIGRFVNRTERSDSERSDAHDELWKILSR
ncbi:hydrogenase expression protein [Synergistales bacterium]|nr:hydrogenase expression protein [Synergistales bacterium]